jgi:hypothetical protein
MGIKSSADCDYEIADGLMVPSTLLQFFKRTQKLQWYNDQITFSHICFFCVCVFLFVCLSLSPKTLKINCRHHDILPLEHLHTSPSNKDSNSCDYSSVLSIQQSSHDITSSQSMSNIPSPCHLQL